MSIPFQSTFFELPFAYRLFFNRVIQECPEEMQEALWNNILVIGGLSTVFFKQLKTELQNVAVAQKRTINVNTFEPPQHAIITGARIFANAVNARDHFTSAADAKKEFEIPDAAPKSLYGFRHSFGEE